ncbi:glycoside hydrolase family 78 protein [Nonomuraea fuscirosea]|uniref:family 78 glycoside hydrolase catalytic domain n=1 Tax=Nonomuraea fuscirosea TaxID=1291556 RepID=UPI002DD9997F|nr:family 78 glycoside hydrolase catalytic domain [Nonomuraea fuscirosea]WSA48913.1 glycoside hydrolase family 78 protein [Nonomuraea fuscirosea]
MVTNLRTCDLTDPLGIELTRPPLTWQLAGAPTQTGYHVRAGSSPGAADLWDSGEVDSADQRVTYDGHPLTSRATVHWRVRVRDGDGNWSGWSDEARFELGLLKAADWSAEWITHPDWHGADGDPRVGEGCPLPLLAGELTLAGPVVAARLYVAGLGVYVASVNGAPVTDAVLEPPYTDFGRRVAYAVHDVTELLRPGANTLGLALGPGIAHVAPHQDRYMKFYGSKASPRAIAQLEVRYADGTSGRFTTGADWLATHGPTTRSHWYGGEDHDARLEPPGWDAPGADRSGWRPVTVRPEGTGMLRSRACPPIRITEELPATARLVAADGTPVFDVGAVVAGWPELDLDLPAGRTLRLVPGDQLDAYGRVVQSKPTTGAPVFNVYTTKDGPQTWHPSFRYDGFRYVEAQGLPEHVGAEALTALVLRADNEHIGTFETSDPLLDDIHTIIDRAVRGNMYSVMTDCPHREKLGWLEQVHLLFDVVAYNYDVAAYSRELLVTIAESQTGDGLVPDIAPEYLVFDGGFRDDPNWGGALVRLPWQLYRHYGDTTALETHYDAMRRYVGYLTSRAEDGITSQGLGDWLAPDSSTPVALPSTWGYWRAAATLARAATVLGRDDDAKRYTALAEDVVAAFARRFAGCRTQAARILTLDMGLTPDEPDALDRLAGAVRAGEITVGEVVLPALFRVLARAGRHDALWAWATSTTHPGYGYQVRHGATALTEAWDGPTSGLSQNHYMLGAIDSWFYRGLGGLGQAPGSNGFRRLLVAPAAPGDLESVRASTATPYGRAGVSWRRSDTEFTLEVEVPPGSSAEVRLPDSLSGQGLDRHTAPAGAVAAGAGAWDVPAGRWTFEARR